MRFRGAQASLSFELVRAFERLLCGDFVTRLVRASQLASETSFGNKFQPKATQISNRKSFIVNYKFVMKWLFDSACLLKSPQSKICKKLVGWPGLVIKAHKTFRLWILAPLLWMLCECGNMYDFNLWNVKPFRIQFATKTFSSLLLESFPFLASGWLLLERCWVNNAGDWRPKVCLYSRLAKTNLGEKFCRAEICRRR